MIASYLMLLCVTLWLIKNAPELRRMAVDRSRRIWLVLLCGIPILAGGVTGAGMPPPAHNPTGRLLITSVLLVSFALLLIGGWLSRAANPGVSRTGVFLMVAASSFWSGFEAGRYVAS